jgi:CheY-like chemotaxis protein/HPt (histidine-containing phosphotransfer) domain-containing protein
LPLFHPTRLFEIADTNERSELIRLFIDQMTGRLPLLADAIAAAQTDAVYQTAHWLEGSAATVGAPRVKDICHALCELTQHGSTQGASELHSQLVGAATHTSAAMMAYLERDDGRLEGVPSAQPADAGGADSIADLRDPVSGVPVRVAIADDDPFARLAIEAMIAHADGLVFVGGAGGVEEAVHLAVVKRPDVIVLDWMMPGGGGAEAARRILCLIANTRIVALTSSDSIEALLKMTHAGAREFLVKGCSPERLAGTIHRAVAAPG